MSSLPSLPVLYSKTSPDVRRLVRAEYVRLQNNLCWYCHGSLSEKPQGPTAELKIARRLFPPNFFKWPVHLHHCHETDWTIGAVHAKCNAVLWQYHGE